MPRPTRSGVLVLAAAASLALAGCGGGSGGGSGAEPAAAASSGGMAMPSAGASPDGAMGASGMMMAPLAKTEWEGMRIELASAPPATFTLMQGDGTKKVMPSPGDSMHLMAVLADAQTGERIPYATVWATITDTDGKTVFDERLWPMISRSMGTHYGINVPLPGPGTYHVSLQIGPPQAARHPEYADKWLEPHTFETDIDWKG